MTHSGDFSAAVSAAVERVLSNGEAHAFDDLVDAVATEVDPDSRDDIGYEVDALLDDVDAYHVTPDDRVVDLRVLLDGRVFSHRMTAGEVDHEVVVLEPDLIVPLWSFPADIPLTAGGAATVRPVGPADLLDGEAGLTATGPEAWLGGAVEDELVGFMVTDGTLSIVRRIDMADTALPEGLRAAFERCIDSDLDSAEILDVVVDGILADPSAFTTPVAPLAELLAAAGLEWRDNWLGRAGTEWMTAAEAHIADRRAFRERIYRFNGCCHDAFDLVMALFSLHGIGEKLPAPMARLGADELAHSVVAEAFVNEVSRLPDDPDEPAGDLFAFAQELEKHARGADRAAVRYVQGMAHEMNGDLPAAERAMHAALAADPNYESAREEASWYSHIRGQWDRAADYLRRSGGGDSLLDLFLERAALSEAATPKTGRNDPCPCGSGKKHKACCLGKDLTPLELRGLWFHAKGIHYIHRPVRRGVIMAMALHVATMISGEHPDDEALRQALSDPLVADLALFEEEGLRDFLDEAGALLPPDEVEMAEGWLESPRALYELVEERGGADEAGDTAVIFRDTRSGETVEVSWGGEPFEMGGFVLARLGRVGTRWRAAGAVSDVPLAHRDALLELTSGPAVTADWLEWLASTLRPPELFAVDGDRLMFCEGIYRVKTKKAALAALAGAFEAGDTPGEFFELVEAEGGGRSLHGSLVLTGRELKVWTTSVERFEKLAARIASLLPDAVLVAEERLTPVEVRARRQHDEPDEGHVVGVESDEELREMLAAKMRDYAERWVEMDIPALGGLTPRQAVDDPTRRQDLLLLLKEFEERPRMPEGDLAVSMPIDYIRELLGLSDPS